METTIQSIHSINYARQTVATFGHLAPKPNKTYEGYVIFALTAFGDTCIIEFVFDQIEASPWFNLDVLDFLADFTDKLPKEKEFGVYRFDGKYSKYNDSKFNFDGKIIEIECGGKNI